MSQLNHLSTVDFDSQQIKLLAETIRAIVSTGPGSSTVPVGMSGSEVVNAQINYDGNSMEITPVGHTSPAIERSLIELTAGIFAGIHTSNLSIYTLQAQLARVENRLVEAHNRALAKINKHLGGE